jgi:hypothetical protein
MGLWKEVPRGSIVEPGTSKWNRLERHLGHEFRFHRGVMEPRVEPTQNRRVFEYLLRILKQTGSRSGRYHNPTHP